MTALAPEDRRKICAAIGWGGLPTYEVVYVKNQKKHTLGDYQLQLNDVPVAGFWSISIYNDIGFFEENRYNARGGAAFWDFDGRSPADTDGTAPY